MGESTPIQWPDSTVNPVMGCSGCELWLPDRKACYAGWLHEWRGAKHKGFSPDFLRPKLFPGRMAEAAAWSDLAGSERPEKPWLNGRPRLIFISDMGDALSERGAIDNDNLPIPRGRVPFEFLRAEIIETVLSPKGQRHVWFWLTKHTQRLLKFDRWLRDKHGISLPTNMWVGTSVTSNATLHRVARLAEVGDGNTHRFVSAEPLWENVSLTDHVGHLGWVIVGGESEQGCSPRQFECDWARNLKGECDRFGVPFFLKQLGADVTDGGKQLAFMDSHRGDWAEWPEDLRVRQVPWLDQVQRFLE